MKTWKFLLPVPVLAALVAWSPQDPQAAKGQNPDDVSVVTRVSEVQYVDFQGKTNVVPSRNLLEIRLLDDVPQGIGIEIIYENGDYSLVHAQGFHVLRSGRDLMDVRLVKSKQSNIRFPKFPR